MLLLNGLKQTTRILEIFSLTTHQQIKFRVHNNFRIILLSSRIIILLSMHKLTLVSGCQKN